MSNGRNCNRAGGIQGMEERFVRNEEGDDDGDDDDDDDGE